MEYLNELPVEKEITIAYTDGKVEFDEFHTKLYYDTIIRHIKNTKNCIETMKDSLNSLSEKYVIDSDTENELSKLMDDISEYYFNMNIEMNNIWIDYNDACDNLTKYSKKIEETIDDDPLFPDAPKIISKEPVIYAPTAADKVTPVDKDAPKIISKESVIYAPTAADKVTPVDKDAPKIISKEPVINAPTAADKVTPVEKEEQEVLEPVVSIKDGTEYGEPSSEMEYHDGNEIIKIDRSFIPQNCSDIEWAKTMIKNEQNGYESYQSLESVDRKRENIFKDMSMYSDFGNNFVGGTFDDEQRLKDLKDTYPKNLYPDYSESDYDLAIKELSQYIMDHANG